MKSPVTWVIVTAHQSIFEHLPARLVRSPYVTVWNVLNLGGGEDRVEEKAGRSNLEDKCSLQRKRIN